MLHILYYIAFQFNHALQQTSLNLLKIYNACTVGASALRIHFFLAFALVSVQVFFLVLIHFICFTAKSLINALQQYFQQKSSKSACNLCRISFLVRIAFEWGEAYLKRVNW